MKIESVADLKFLIAYKTARETGNQELLLKCIMGDSLLDAAVAELLAPPVSNPTTASQVTKGKTG